jgi:hypothetical protein
MRGIAKQYWDPIYTLMARLRPGTWCLVTMLVGVGVFIQPYVILFVPWLVWISGPAAPGALALTVCVLRLR